MPEPLKDLSFLRKCGKHKEAYDGWKVWDDVCGNESPIVWEWMGEAKGELPKESEELAKRAILFFPLHVFNAIDKSLSKLTETQDIYLFGLVAMQGLLMTGQVDSQKTGLGEKAEAVTLAMVKYWVCEYGRIYRSALHIEGENTSRGNREKILKDTFNDACDKLRASIPEARSRACANKALSCMSKNCVGLHELSKDGLDETTLYGLEVLNQAMSATADGLNNLERKNDHHGVKQISATPSLPFEVVKYHTNGITVKWKGVDKKISSKVFGAELVEIIKTGAERVKVKRGIYRDNLKNDEFLSKYFCAQTDQGATYLRRRY